LLKVTSEELFEISVERYEACERELRRRYDIKGFNFYQLSHYEANAANASIDSNGMTVKTGGSDPNRSLTNWINKCGGTYNLTLKPNVNVAIVEMPKLKAIIESFEAWRTTVLSSI